MNKKPIIIIIAILLICSIASLVAYGFSIKAGITATDDGNDNHIGRGVNEADSNETPSTPDRIREKNSRGEPLTEEERRYQLNAHPMPVK